LGVRMDTPPKGRKRERGSGSGHGRTRSEGAVLGRGGTAGERGERDDPGADAAHAGGGDGDGDGEDNDIARREGPASAPILDGVAIPATTPSAERGTP
jgi:hypothetical protein